MKHQNDVDHGLPAGYTEADGGLTEAEEEAGYCVEGMLDLNDVFGAFVEPNYGLVGGACTVDDFTPEGILDRPLEGGQISQRNLHIEGHSGTSKRSGSGAYSQKYP